jgi:hypothetical protein
MNFYYVLFGEFIIKIQGKTEEMEISQSVSVLSRNIESDTILQNVGSRRDILFANLSIEDNLREENLMLEQINQERKQNLRRLKSARKGINVIEDVYLSNPHLNKKK